MKRNKRNHSPRFKAAVALEAIRGKCPVKDIALAHSLNPTLVHAWRSQFAQATVALFRGHGKANPSSSVSRGVERRLQELKTEQNWMRRAVSALNLREKRASVQSGELSLLAQSRLLGLHRSGLYYQKQKSANTHCALPASRADSGTDAVRQTA